MSVTRDQIALWPDATLLTRRETAVFLNCRPQLLEEWAVHSKGPPYLREGSRFVRYKLGDVRAWANSRTRKTINRARGA